jgi:hypothetical protein
MKSSEYSENAHLLILLIALLYVISILHILEAYHKVYYRVNVNRTDEQSTELTYPTNDEQPTELTTIRLVLASDDSDKENHIPDIRRDEITVKLEQPTTESLRGNSVEGTGGSTAINRSC